MKKLTLKVGLIALLAMGLSLPQAMAQSPEVPQGNETIISTPRLEDDDDDNPPPPPPPPNVFSIDENELKVKLFPNPTSGRITLQSTGTMEQGEVIVTNLTGSVVHKSSLASVNFSEGIELNMSRLKAGTYFVNLGKERVRFIKI